MDMRVLIALCVICFAGPAFASKIIGNGKVVGDGPWAVVTTTKGCAVQRLRPKNAAASVAMGYETKKSAFADLLNVCPQPTK